MGKTAWKAAKMSYGGNIAMWMGGIVDAIILDMHDPVDRHS